MWEIYAYQNADSLFGVFNAAAAIHASGDYAAAVAAVAFCGFVAALIAYAFAPEKLQGWKLLGVGGADIITPGNEEGPRMFPGPLRAVTIRCQLPPYGASPHTNFSTPVRLLLQPKGFRNSPPRVFTFHR